MQTLIVDIQDNFVQDFLTILEQYKDKVTLKKDKNLEYDPYFYERQKKLQEDLREIENGTAQMISNEDFWNDINNHIQTIK